MFTTERERVGVKVEVERESLDLDPSLYSLDLHVTTLHVLNTKPNSTRKGSAFTR